MQSKIELDISALVSTLGSCTQSQRQGLWDPSGNTIQGDAYILVDDAFVACIQDVQVFKPFRSRIFRGDFITFQFMQSSGSYYHHLGGQIVKMGSGSLSLTVAPFSETESRGHLRPSTARGVAIHIARDHLLGSFGLRPQYWREEYRDAFFRKGGASLSLNAPLTAEMWTILDSMIDCGFDEPMRSNYLRAKAIELLTQAVVEFNELLFHEIVAARDIPLSVAMPRDKRISGLAQAALDDPGSIASIDEWLVGASASRKTIERLFIAETGMPPSRWLRQIRILHAVSQLAAGKKISSVALDLGYQSPSAFTYMFRSAIGLSPRVFRRTEKSVGR